MWVVKLKESFEAGVEKIRGLASLLAERFRVEAAVIKLIRESGELEKKRDGLVREIGERVFELRGRSELSVLDDSRIRRALAELEKLDREIEELKGKASEIGKIE